MFLTDKQRSTMMQSGVLKPAAFASLIVKGSCISAEKFAEQRIAYRTQKAAASEAKKLETEAAKAMPTEEAVTA